MNRIIQDIFGPWSNENKVVLHKVFSNKFDVLPIGKQINLMHVADGMISSSNIKGSVLDYLKSS
jgi:hypothetical protein